MAKKLKTYNVGKFQSVGYVYSRTLEEVTLQRYNDEHQLKWDPLGLLAPASWKWKIKLFNAMFFGENSLPVETYDGWKIPGRKLTCDHWGTRSCGRRDCIYCFRKAGWKRAKKVAHFIREVALKEGVRYKLKHAVWDLQFAEEYLDVGPDQLFEAMEKVHRGKDKLGVLFVFHPYRNSREEFSEKVWARSPHYHMITNFDYDYDNQWFQLWQMANQALYINITRKLFYQDKVATDFIDLDGGELTLEQIISYELSHHGYQEQGKVRSYYGRGIFNRAHYRVVGAKDGKGKRYIKNTDGTIRLDNFPMVKYGKMVLRDPEDVRNGYYVKLSVKRIHKEIMSGVVSWCLKLPPSKKLKFSDMDI